MYPSVGLARFALVALVLTALFGLSVAGAEAAMRTVRHEMSPVVHAVDHRLAQEQRAVEGLARQGAGRGNSASSSP